MGAKLSRPLHPYVEIWIGCRKYSGGLTSAPVLPQTGGYLDQDAELMLAFDLLQEIYEQLETERKAREENIRNAQPQ